MILIDTKPINVKSFHAGYHRLLNSLFCSSIFKTKTPQILNLQGISKLVHRGACPGAPGARPFLPCCTFPLCGLVLPCWPADRMEGSLAAHHHHLPLTNPPLLEGGGEPTNGAGAACPSSNGAALSICAAAAPIKPPRHLPRGATDVPINLKYSQAGLHHRRRGLSRISEALERKGSIWWGPSQVVVQRIC